ncbi:AMP-binding protein [Kordiimonas pumila]|uniref:Long-chain-fatty-acid--CoA ligase n=1 Tax=Kordiimonas pumila TaxID=2161677 RepID=A0ABV7D229_9PROT|nr:AMP-binding protein [Kordiimonas pumila]
MANIEFTAGDMLGKHMGDIVNKSVAEYGDRPAFSCILPTGHSATLSYRELGELSDAVAVYLREELKLVPDDVVAIQSPNVLAYPVLAFGIFKAGLTVTNVNPLYTPEETNHQLKDSGAKVWFIIDVFGNRVDESIVGTKVEKVFKISLVDFFPTVQRVLLGFAMKHIKKIVPAFTGTLEGTMQDVIKKGRELLTTVADMSLYTQHVGYDTIAIYQYTGGTTGRSKGAELTHGNIVGNISQFSKQGSFEIESNDILLLILPLYHVYALAVGALNSVTKGLHVVLVAVPRPLSNLKPAFDKFDITIMPGVNTLYLGLMQEKWFLDNPPKTLRLCSSGAAPLQPATAKAWESLVGTKIREGYGLTESTCVVSSTPFNVEPRAGSCGLPLPGTETRIVDSEGNIMPTGEVGELLIKGPQIMKGYLNNPEATNATIVDGWLKTGDIAKLDEDGYIYIVDRLKDMVIVSGFNVYPADIEDILTRHDKIGDAAVVGVPDAETGERVIAYVVSKDKALSEQDIIAYCKHHLTSYKVPKTIVFLDELPKSPVGKVLRRELRDMALKSFCGTK